MLEPGNKIIHVILFIPDCSAIISKRWFGKPPKKKVKKFHNKCELWGGGGQQILVCEPQKSAFFGANFPKKML